MCFVEYIHILCPQFPLLIMQYEMLTTCSCKIMRKKSKVHAQVAQWFSDTWVVKFKAI